MRRLCAVVIVAGMTAGCAPWKVVHQAKPNPLANQREFAVAPVDFSRLGDPAHIGQLCVEPSLPKDCLAVLEEEFLHALKVGEELKFEAPDRTSAPFVVRAQVLTLDPGVMSATEKRSSQVVMVVRVEHQDGRVLDEIQLKTGMKPSAVEPAPGFRVWMDGGILGERLRTYLYRRAEVSGAQ